MPDTFDVPADGAVQFLAVDAAAALLTDAVCRTPGETLAQQAMAAARRNEDGQPAARLPKPRHPRLRELEAAQWLTCGNLYL